jgi:hypothetical protein
VLASIWELPVYINVQYNFHHMADREFMVQQAELLALAIQHNDTLLGAKERMQKTIREWVELFDKFFGQTYTKKVDEFVETTMEVSRLDEDEKYILEDILTLYWSLKIGDIYREIEGDPPIGYEEAESTPGKSVEDYYLEGLLDEEQNLNAWFENYEEIAYWLDITEKSEEFIGKLFFVLKKRVDVADQKQVDLLLRFIDALKKRGVESIDEVFYFDEEAGAFRWNEDYLIPFSEEESVSGEQSETAPAQRKES